MRNIRLLPLLALGLSLAACGGTKNRGLESVHQPVVTRTDYVYDVPAGLNGEDERRLSGWLESLRVGYGDRISVDDPSGNPASRNGVAAVAARYGLLVDEAAPVTEGEVAPGTFRVIVSRSKAEVPGCPDWSRASQPEFGANTMSNYGCATNANLAAMVANPEDLIVGRGSSVADAQTAGKAIKSYRTLPPTGAQGLSKENTRSAN